MKVSLFAFSVSLVIAGCVDNSDETSTSDTVGRESGMPNLYTELDSIVFNQLDYVYFNHTRMQMPTNFSEAAMEMLSDDTLLFHRDTVYPYDSTPAVETFLRTKFDPKGWFGFHDARNSVICKPDTSGQTEGWFIRTKSGSDTISCILASGLSPTTFQLYTIHYPGKGFVFVNSSFIAELDLGKARVYYWR